VPYAAAPTRRSVERLAGASAVPLWLDTDQRPAASPPLVGTDTCDLAVVGAGFTGLWTALLAKQADQTRDVVLLEGGRVAQAATGRNGGFCSGSLTHGLSNGHTRFAAELAQLLRLGEANLAAIEATVAEFGIDCDWRRADDLVLATDPHHVADLAEAAELAHTYGQQAEVLDADQVREHVVSPRYLGGLLGHGDLALVDPARLAWGLARACLAAGVRLFEGSPVTGMTGDGTAVRLSTPAGTVRARRVALATNAFPPLLKRLRHYVVPVWDYCIATEPLPEAVLAEIGWGSGEGLSDASNQFHYYRLTHDRRIVFGGYDAVYYRGNGFGAHFEQRAATAALLVEHLTQTFPATAEVGISHSWGGAIDTCSRFSAFWGTASGGRVGYVAGYTGLGVGASRFGAAVLLDLLDGRDTELTRLQMVRSKPLPFPPEPVRGIGIDLTRRAFDRADRAGGRRGPWLKLLDAVGLGFDS
jgi:glycine/D-amino acid oxidase-like deaminating enzyme